MAPISRHGAFRGDVQQTDVLQRHVRDPPRPRERRALGGDHTGFRRASRMSSLQLRLERSSERGCLSSGPARLIDTNSLAEATGASTVAASAAAIATIPTLAGTGREIVPEATPRGAGPSLESPLHAAIV